MKKILSIMAVSVFVLTANSVLAGGPGKKQPTAGCPEECQQQLDDLQSSQAQQNERLGGHDKQLQNHEKRITALEEGTGYKWYARVGLKLVWPDQEREYGAAIDGEMGWGGQIAAGVQFSDFRIELELADQKADLEDNNDGDVQLQTVMVNGYYQYPIYDAFYLYGTVGAGFGKYDLNANRVNGRDTAFAYKAGAGVSYVFTDQMAADFGYEYLGSSATVINGAEINDPESNNLVASFRFTF